MQKYNRNNRKKHLNTSVNDFYTQSLGNELPTNHIIQENFLYKNETPICLVTSGILEALTEGFIHIEEITPYNAKWLVNVM